MFKLKISTAGLLLCFTITNSNLQAMEAPEKDKSLYTKVMKSVSDPAAKINLEYLSTLPRTLEKGDRIYFDQLLSEPENSKHTITPIALAILAGDEKRVRDFLKRKSKANFNYPDEKKEKLAAEACEFQSSLNTEEFIKKHLYTKQFINPNDPLLYTYWSTFSDGPNCYSLVHLALNPYFKSFYNDIPNYLPKFESIKEEARLHVIDALAESGADFNCFPLHYHKTFLGEVSKDYSYRGRHPIGAARCHRNCFSLTNMRSMTTESLMGHALLYGANIKSSNSIWYDPLKIPQYLPIIESSETIKKFKKDLLENTFDQIFQGKISSEKICLTEYVKERLNKMKIEKIEQINKIIEIEAKKGALTDPNWAEININGENVKDLLCAMGEYYRTGEDREAAIQKLSNELECITNLEF